MKTGTVIEVIENFKQFSNNNGNFHVHIITMDNGEKGEYNSKTPQCIKFKKGEKVNYEFTAGTGTYMGKIKPAQEQPQQNASKGSYNEDLSLAQTCIKSSCEYYQERQSTVEDVLGFADSLFAWAKLKSQK